MLEIERKILDINPTEVIKQVKELGAKENFSSKISTYYLDYPDFRFKKQDQLLRIRQIGEIVEAAYKFNRSEKNNTRTYTEKEFVVDANQLDDLLNFFTSLGFIQTMYFEKHRIEYILQNAELRGKHIQQVKFEIDTYPHLNPFLEIETDSAETIDLLINELRLQTHEQTTETINELFSRKNPHLTLDKAKLP